MERRAFVGAWMKFSVTFSDIGLQGAGKSGELQNAVEKSLFSIQKEPLRSERLSKC